MGNTLVTVQPKLTRTSFYPGSIVEGSLCVTVKEKPQDYYGIRIICVGELFQQYTDSSGDSSTTYTQALSFSQTVITCSGCPEGTKKEDKRILTLDVGEHEFPFKFQLATNSLSAGRVGSDPCVQIRYFIRSVVETADSFWADCTGEVQFNVLYAMPASQYNVPSSITAEQTVDVECCCCNNGTVHIAGNCSKTCVALDRDEIQFTCKCDNTNGEKDIETLTVKLIAKAVAKIGYCLKPQYPIATVEVPLETPIKAGEEREVSGTLKLKLNPLPPVSMSTPIVDFGYVLEFEPNISCICTDPGLFINMLVAHSVDETNQSLQTQQMWAQAQQIDPELLRHENSSGVFEVANLASPAQEGGWQPLSQAQGGVPPSLPAQEMSQMTATSSAQQQPNIATAAYANQQQQQQQAVLGYPVFPGQQYNAAAATAAPPPAG